MVLPEITGKKWISELQVREFEITSIFKTPNVRHPRPGNGLSNAEMKMTSCSSFPNKWQKVVPTTENKLSTQNNRHIKFQDVSTNSLSDHEEFCKIMKIHPTETDLMKTLKCKKGKAV